MIIMALDHVRDFFASVGNPTDPATTTVGHYATRWITHFCAPGFFLLVGVGAYLARHRLGTTGKLARFLVTRGLWLLILEIVVVRFALQFNLDYHVTLLNVMWALGWAMIVLSGLVFLPLWAIAALAVVVISGHNLLDGIQASALGRLAPLWTILHSLGFLINDGKHVVFIAYPLIPWVAVTALGYALGAIYEWEGPRRRRFLVGLGGAMILLFLVLRALNRYGDPSPWSAQDSPLFTALSFLNTSKYPPSLLFLLMTLGPILLLLAALDGRTPRILRPALPFGRVPLFYFVLHLTLIHLIAVVVCLARYGEIHWMLQSDSLGQFPITQPPGWPLALPYAYLIWIGVVLALYPLCRAYAELKRRRSDWWLSYL